MQPKRERTLYEITSSFFAMVVICVAVAGMLVAGLGDEGPGSAAFAICTVFLGLGLGRLYLGLRRGNEGAQPQSCREPKPTAEPRPRPDRSRPPPLRSPRRRP